MLVIDAEKRLSIKEIILHKWMRMTGEDEDFEKLIEESLEAQEVKEEMPLHEEILKSMESLGIEREQTIEVCQWSGQLLLPLKSRPSDCLTVG